ncbi:hypothetical protein R0J90_13815, partial [Micrococcus sp. SIMBA_144]
MDSPINFITDSKKGTKDNLIIFVHGFTGDSNTWVNSEGKSFAEMLLESPLIKKNFDICYFNYFTK